MIQSVSKLYEGLSLTRTTLNLTYLRIDTPGTIKSIFVYCGSNVVVGQAIFNLRINGTSQWTADNRLTVSAGSLAVSKTGLNIAVTRGDVMILDLEQSAQSGTPAPIQLIVDIDDGISAETDIAADIHAATAKTTPINADEFALVDSAASNVLKKLSWQNLKATLKTYFDSLYQAVLVSGTNIKTINSQSLLGSGDISISGGGGGSVNAYAGIFADITAPGALADFTRQDSNATNNTITEIGGGNSIRFIASDTSGVMIITKDLVSTSSWTVTIGFRANSAESNTFWNAGMYMFDSVNGKAKTFHLFPERTDYDWGAANVNFPATYASNSLSPSTAEELTQKKDRLLVFMRVIKTGTTLDHQLSYDNVLWRSVGTGVSNSHTTTIDKVGFLCLGGSSSNGAYAELAHFSIT